MSNNKMHGILFAYRSNDQMGELTLHRTLASLPFGGRYRVIDFMLSNMVNAGITDVGVVMNESYQSLMDHLGSGKDFELARRSGGLKLLPPFAYANSDRRGSRSVYRGTMDALGGIFSYLQEIKAEYVVMADAHTIMNIDLKKVLDQHIASGADITAVVTSKPSAVSRDATYFTTNGEGTRVKEVIVRPSAPEGLESLNIYILSTALLLKITEKCVDHDVYSLSEGVLRPHCNDLKIYPYVYDDYANRIQSVKGFYDHNMQLLDTDIRNTVFAPERPIRTKERNDASTYYAPESSVKNSMIADGCKIVGTVENSVIFHNVTIEKGAVVKNSVIMQNTVVKAGADVEYIIADKNVTITEGRKLIGAPSAPTVLKKNLEV